MQELKIEERSIFRQKKLQLNENFPMLLSLIGQRFAITEKEFLLEKEKQVKKLMNIARNKLLLKEKPNMMP